MDTYGPKVLGLSGGLGGGAIAALPNTGGSRNVVLIVAIASLGVGVAVLISTVARSAAKRFSA